MVIPGSSAAAELPPDDLPGLAPEWSRLVTVADGVTWHVLDTAPLEPERTILCVHGNPTWSYLWRDLLAAAPTDVRVVAVDQLEMGFSERTGRRRRLADRIDDLSALTAALGIEGRVVTVGHDWGGPVSVGWAVQHVAQLEGIVLMNTAVDQPEPTPGATLLRLAQAAPLRRLLCQRTPWFVRGATALSRPRPAAAVRRGYESPYLAAHRRKGIADFVADIPFRSDHPTAATLAEIAAFIPQLADVPALLVWGGKDPIFNDVYLRDLQRRFPAAVTHRLAGAGHLVPEDADVAGVVLRWMEELPDRRTRPVDEGHGIPASAHSATGQRRRVWLALQERAEDEDLAIAEIADGEVRRASFAELERRVTEVAAGLLSHRVCPGDRVALLVEPGIDLAAALHAVWRVGGVAVFVDAGLGGRGISSALASAAPRFLIGGVKALAAATAMRWPGERISVTELAAPLRRTLRSAASLTGLRDADVGPLPLPAPDDIAAVAFTSGATGPAKGVRYKHRQVEAQRDALMQLYGIQPSDRLVAAFAPFALYGPLMGIASIVPDMDITAPATLTATKLAEAVSAIDATLVFASPAALRNVVATAGEVTLDQRAALHRVRLVLSAGAPVDRSLLRSVRRVLPAARIHTPYGMTEVLPVADVSLEELEQLEAGRGVCVGRPVDGVDLAIAPLDAPGTGGVELVTDPDVTGEVCVRAEHMRDGYDQLWATELAASSPPGWHRTGDVGHLDAHGRLWIEGRLAHVVTTAAGPVTPVPIEQTINAQDEVMRSAVVGVGPSGAQVVAVVVEPAMPVRVSGLADLDLADAIRGETEVDVAAVLVVPELPVDIRHNSKIDRIALASWASEVCAGLRSAAP